MKYSKEDCDLIIAADELAEQEVKRIRSEWDALRQTHQSRFDETYMREHLIVSNGYQRCVAGANVILGDLEEHKTEWAEKRENADE